MPRVRQSARTGHNTARRRSSRLRSRASPPTEQSAWRLNFFREASPSWLASTACAVPLAVCATTGPVRVLSVGNTSNKPVYKCKGFPIAAVSFVTPPQITPNAFHRQACDSRRDARRPRRPRGRHRAPQRVDTPTSNAVRRRRSPSSSAFNNRVWTPSAALVTPCSGCVI